MILQEGDKTLKRKFANSESEFCESLHWKNPFFRKQLDFQELAVVHPILQQHLVKCKSAYNIDWTDIASVKALTTAVLLKEFNIDIIIPPDHLCPPLPNRLNYICWLSDLIDCTNETISSSSARLEHSHLICDIGIGPLCIYPLLGHKMFEWSFYGVDIDSEAVDWASQNIAKNNLASNIRVALVTSSTQLQQRILDLYLSVASTVSTTKDTTAFDENTADGNETRLCDIIVDKATGDVLRGPVSRTVFAMSGIHAERLLECEREVVVKSTLANHVKIPRASQISAFMTNPPFYTLDEHIQTNSSTVCTGSVSEMRTTGGEVAFVTALIADSLVLRETVVWYTSMLGKKASVTTLKNILIIEGIPSNQIFSTDFIQGKTRRWGLAWTFCSDAAKKYSQYRKQSQDDVSEKQPFRFEIDVSRANFEATVLTAERTQQQRCEADHANSTTSVVSNEKCNEDGGGGNMLLLRDVVQRVICAISASQPQQHQQSGDDEGSGHSQYLLVPHLTCSSVGDCDVFNDSKQVVLLYSLVHTTAYGKQQVVCDLQFNVSIDIQVPTSAARDVHIDITAIEPQVQQLCTSGDPATIRKTAQTLPTHAEAAMLSNNIRVVLHKFKEVFEANIVRTNRKWRRQLQHK